MVAEARPLERDTRKPRWPLMTFDIPTLMAAGALLTGASSILIFLAWLADRSAPALAWWAGGNALIATGIGALLATGGSPSGDNPLGPLLLILGPPCLWTATRIFRGRRPAWLVSLAAPVLLIGSGIVLGPSAATLVNLALCAAFFAATAIELVGEGVPKLRARWPLIVSLLVHTSIFAGGAYEAAGALIPTHGPISLGLWFGLIHFEQLIFALASSIFLVAMVREASESRHRHAAHIDALTGVASRRAFFEGANAALRECLTDDAPFSLVIFDLDRFKLVNDTHGHASGDLVLQAFGETVRTKLREDDIVGRLGGEEFAVAMPGSSAGMAQVVAERIRRAFGAMSVAGHNGPVATTVSGGVATAHPSSTMDSLIEAADTALYRAKTLGRNRIEMAPEGEKTMAEMVRVA